MESTVYPAQTERHAEQFAHSSESNLGRIPWFSTLIRVMPPRVQAEKQAPHPVQSPHSTTSFRFRIFRGTEAQLDRDFRQNEFSQPSDYLCLIGLFELGKHREGNDLGGDAFGYREVAFLVA